ncbi:MAG: ABC transporter ATP-binding protein/permease [Oscillospiraceae bacterium]|nr:ABC transporter ATP-binding protein/permease [Oscillospiraceae bacterium]
MSEERVEGIQEVTMDKESFKKAWSKIVKFFKPWYIPTIIATLFAAASVVIMLFGPMQIRDMVNYIFRGAMGEDTHSQVVSIGVLLIVLYGISFVLAFISNYIIAGSIQKAVVQLRRRISQKVNRVPLAYHDKNQIGDTLSRITNDSATVSDTLSFGMVQLISSVIQVVGAIVFMFVEDWRLAITAIVASIIGFVLLMLIMSKSQKHFEAEQKKLADLNSHIEEYYGGHTVIKKNNASEEARAAFGGLNKTLYQSTWKARFFEGVMMPIMFFVGQLGFVAVCIVGGMLVFNGSISFGTIASFMIFIDLFTMPLGNIAECLGFMQRTAAASNRVFDFVEEKELPDESHIENHIETAKGDVEFKDIKFEYVEGKPVIKNFSAKIPAGSKVAIVGPTGAGKTTMVNLLMKFYTPQSGDIMIDGHCIKELKRENVSDLFAMVLQDTWLFEGTVKENLLYNIKLDPDKEKEVLENAVKMAGIDKLIKTLPKGYDTILNESTNVSAGEKQLITIARAMIKNAPLLILDEATSSVDTRTEAKIQKAMDHLMEGNTSFVIAHRLSTIKNADMILVMKEGDIVESGNHEKLLEDGGFYSELYNSQFAS